MPTKKKPTELYWIDEYKRRRAFWAHDLNPKRPHPLITSNQHSDRYTNSELILEDPILLDKACSDLVKCIRIAGLDLETVDRVIGPEKGAIKIAHDVARRISNARERLAHCLSAYAEKEGEGDRKRMVLNRFAIYPGERILLVEDVLTTGGSINLTALAVEMAGGVVLPYVMVLVNSSRRSRVDGRRVVSLINRPIPVWTRPNCPLCLKGSEAIQPKGLVNWARLNAEYSREVV